MEQENKAAKEIKDVSEEVSQEDTEEYSISEAESDDDGESISKSTVPTFKDGRFSWDYKYVPKGCWKRKKGN
jgi:hypothetical protein